MVGGDSAVNRKILATALALFTLLATLAASEANAQSSPNLQYGQVPTAAQWKSYFAGKVDTVGGALTGGTFTNPTILGTVSGGARVDSETVVATGGTSARSLAARAADVVNVKDFGAVGDGSTNDTAAFNVATSYAADLAYGLHIPAGTFRVSTINYPVGLAGIFGAGINETTVKRIDSDPSTNYLIQSSGVHNGVQVADLTLDGNRANQTNNGAGIVTSTGDYNIYIHDVRVINQKSAGGFGGSFGWGIHINDNGDAFQQVAAFTATIPASGNGDVLVVSAFSSGVGALAPGEVIRGTDVPYGQTIVGQLSGTPGNIGNYQLSTASVVTGGESMTAGTQSTSRIVNVVASNNDGDGVTAVNTAHNILISGVSAIGNGGGGIVIAGSGLLDREITHVSILNSIASGNRVAGISITDIVAPTTTFDLAGAQWVLISNNLATDNHNYGIVIQATYGTVSGNIVENNGAAGILANAADVTVTGNIITANMNFNIDAGGCASCTFTANTIADSYSYPLSGVGINLGGAPGAVVVGNSFLNNGARASNDGGAGIVIHPWDGGSVPVFPTITKNALVSGNKFLLPSGSTAYAVNVTGDPAGVVVKNNVLTGGLAGHLLNGGSSSPIAVSGNTRTEAMAGEPIAAASTVVFPDYTDIIQLTGGAASISAIETTTQQTGAGTLTGLAIDSAGSACTALVVGLSGGGGSGAAATGLIFNGGLTGFANVVPGSGYTSLPTVSFSGSSCSVSPTATAIIGYPNETDGRTITLVNASGNTQTLVNGSGLSLSGGANLSLEAGASMQLTGYNGGWAQTSPVGNAVTHPWTPSYLVGGSAAGITYSVQQGAWYQSGKQVCYYGSLTAASFTAGHGTGAVAVVGLPNVAASSAISQGYPAQVGYAQGWSGLTVPVAAITPGSVSINLGLGVAVGSGAVTDANFTSSSGVAFSGCYPVN